MWGASWTMCKSLSFLQVLGHAPLPSSYFMGGSNGRGHVIHVEVVWVDVLAKATHATNVKEVIMGEAQPPRGATRCPQPYLIYCILTAGHTGASLGGAAGPHSVAYSSHIHPSRGAVTGPGSSGHSCFGPLLSRDLGGHHVGCPSYTDISPVQHGPVQRGEKDTVSRVRGDVGASGGHLVG